MEWLQVLTIGGSTIGAYWWFKRDSDARLDKFSDRLDKFSDSFQKEMKDFHGRLCALEEKYLQMMKNQEETRTKLILEELQKRK